MFLRDAILLGAAALFTSVNSLMSEPMPPMTNFSTKPDISLRTSVDEENEERAISRIPLREKSKLDDAIVSSVKHMNNQFRKYDDKRASVLSEAREKYTDGALALLLEAGRENKLYRKDTTELQTQLMKAWKSEGMSTDAVVKTLKLAEGSNPTLSRLAFNTLLRYIREFDPSPQTTISDTLRKYYFGDVLSKLAEKNPSLEKLAQKLQQLESMDESVFPNKVLVSPDTVLKYLKLDIVPQSRQKQQSLKLDMKLLELNTKNSIFDNPYLNNWLQYAFFYARKTSGDPETIVINTLRRHFTDEQLVGMLDASRTEFGATRNFKHIEESLLETWYVEKLLPASVSRRFGNDAKQRYLDKIEKINSAYYEMR